MFEKNTPRDVEVGLIARLFWNSMNRSWWSCSSSPFFSILEARRCSFRFSPYVHNDSWCFIEPEQISKDLSSPFFHLGTSLIVRLEFIAPSSIIIYMLRNRLHQTVSTSIGLLFWIDVLRLCFIALMYFFFTSLFQRGLFLCTKEIIIHDLEETSWNISMGYVLKLCS